MIACEPTSRAPLARALAADQPALIVEAAPTAAYGVAVSVGGYRGRVVLRESGGRVALADGEALREGLWQELSGAIGVAGLRATLADGQRFDGPVVCIGTSSGFKDIDVGEATIPTVEPEWSSVAATLRREYGIGN